MTAVLAVVTGAGGAAHLERHQCQLAEFEYVQVNSTVVLLAFETVTVTVTVIVIETVTMSVSVTMTLAEAVSAAVVVRVAETMRTVSVVEAHVQPAEQALLGMLLVTMVLTEPGVVCRLSMLAGFELGTSWG